MSRVAPRITTPDKRGHRNGKAAKKSVSRKSTGTRGRTTVIEAWTKTKNDRRCDLIDKEIGGTITPFEKKELEILQSEMLAFRRRVAPLPIEEARKLHSRLMAKAGMSPQ